MRKHLDLLLTERTLSFIRRQTDSDILDKLVVDLPEPSIKNLCAKVSSQLVDRLDETCHILDISKRKFIETAIIDALERANQIMGEEGLWEAIDDYNAQAALAGVPSDATLLTGV